MRSLQYHPLITTISLYIGTTQYQIPADSSFNTQQEFIDLLSSAFDEWSEIISITKPIAQFIASKVQKDIPTTIYSDAWKSPLEVLLGEFSSTGQTNPVWTIHLCLGCSNGVSETRPNDGDIKADTVPKTLRVKSEEEPAKKPDPDSPATTHKRSLSDVLEELEKQRERTERIEREYEEQAEKFALQLANLANSEQYTETNAESEKAGEENDSLDSNDEKTGTEESNNIIEEPPKG
jgi:hypothetical protein